MTSLRSFLRVAPLGAALVVGLAAGPAHAKLGEGQRPPALEGQDFINTDAIDFKTLRGRVVLCEIFSPT